MTTKRTLPAFVEIGPDKFMSMKKLTVGQLRRALIVERTAGEEARFRALLWLRRRIPADTKDSDLVIESAGVSFDGE